MPVDTPAPKPLVVTAEMGYGHIRAARPIASALGVEVTMADREPLAAPGEKRIWDLVRHAHESSSRGSELPVVGRPIRRLLEMATMIPPLHPYRDLAGPSFAARLLDHLIERGFGSTLVDRLRATGQPLVTTFYAPAIVADRAGIESIYCIVTDADINRVWVPARPRGSRIRYLAPSRRAVRRLEAFGVPPDRISFTGFPLPASLVGDEHLHILRRNLGPRLARLDPKRRFREQFHHELSHFFSGSHAEHEGEPPLLTFAVGGAGAQAGLVDAFLPEMRPGLLSGKIRLALVAGTRVEVLRRFERALDGAGLGHRVGEGIELLHEPELDTYFRRFDELLARTDILWTKPSELTFYAGLGIPLVLTHPVGVHERFNRRLAREQGVGLKQRAPRHIASRIREWLADGTLAAAAWSGFMRLPKFGTARVLEEIDASRPLSLAS